MLAGCGGGSAKRAAWHANANNDPAALVLATHQVALAEPALDVASLALKR